MFVLHAAIRVKPGHEEAARSVYTQTFERVISAQPGFKSVEFLKAVDTGEYVLVIAFESEALQQKWVATGIHTQVWSEMEVNFESYIVKKYNTILAP